MSSLKRTRSIDQAVSDLADVTGTFTQVSGKRNKSGNKRAKNTQAVDDDAIVASVKNSNVTKDAGSSDVSTGIRCCGGDKSCSCSETIESLKLELVETKQELAHLKDGLQKLNAHVNLLLSALGSSTQLEQPPVVANPNSSEPAASQPGNSNTVHSPVDASVGPKSCCCCCADSQKLSKKYRVCCLQRFTGKTKALQQYCRFWIEDHRIQ